MRGRAGAARAVLEPIISLPCTELCVHGSSNMGESFCSQGTFFTSPRFRSRRVPCPGSRSHRHVALFTGRYPSFRTRCSVETGACCWQFTTVALMAALLWDLLHGRGPELTLLSPGGLFDLGQWTQDDQTLSSLSSLLNEGTGLLCPWAISRACLPDIQGLGRRAVGLLPGDPSWLLWPCSCFCSRLTLALLNSIPAGGWKVCPVLGFYLGCFGPGDLLALWLWGASCVTEETLLRPGSPGSES